MTKIIGVSNISKFIGVSRFKFFNSLFGDNGLDSYTKLLLKMNGLNNSTTFIDETGKIITAHGNAKISTVQYRFDGSSGYFDGTGGYISVPNNTDWNFGSGDFTIDYWFNQTTLTSPWFNQQAHVNQWGGQGNMSWFVWIQNNTINFVYSNDGYSYVAKNIGSSGILLTNTWYHIAVVRYGSTITIYLNGAPVANGSETGSIFTSTSDLRVGLSSHDGATQYFNGYIDELRISKGIARWTTNFTPPSSPYGG